MVDEEYQPEEREKGPPRRQQEGAGGVAPSMRPEDLEERERRLGEVSREIPIPEDEDVEATRPADQEHADAPPTKPAPPPER
jgi:hypothetical protein